MPTAKICCRQAFCIYAVLLFVILNGAFKEFKVEFAGNILIKTACGSLGMTHFAENSAVRRDNALYCKIGIIRVKGDIICCVAAEINILSDNLTVGGKLSDKSFVGNETTLAV